MHRCALAMELLHRVESSKPATITSLAEVQKLKRDIELGPQREEKYKKELDELKDKYIEIVTCVTKAEDGFAKDKDPLQKPRDGEKTEEEAGKNDKRGRRKLRF